MKTKTLLICSLLMITLISLAQPEDMNKYNAAGQKQGKWVIFLDKYWSPQKDSVKAVYCRHTYYENGVDLYPMGQCGKKGWKLEMDKGAKDLTYVNIIVLNGVYKWLDKQGRVMAVHDFQGGQYYIYKEFYTSGKLKQHFEYYKRWKNQWHTYCVHTYDKKGNAKHFFMRNGDNGWNLYQCEAGDIVE